MEREAHEMGKPVPQFWWDFTQPAESPIVVQSDWIGGKCLAEFPFITDATHAIARAEALISDFKAGRKTPLWGRISGVDPSR
jgi:hypothetical protein